MLDSLRIQGFRCFRDLKIPRLGRVNLVVGKNNVGKTTLLEALSVYAAGHQAADEIRRLLAHREEPRAAGYMKPHRHFDPARVFYKPPRGSWSLSFSVGPLDKAEAILRVSLTPPDGSRHDGELASLSDLVTEVGGQRHVVQVARALDAQADALEPWRSGADIARDSPRQARPAVFLRAGGLQPSERLQLWNAATSSNIQNEVLDLLRVIAPEVERVHVDRDGASLCVVSVRRRGTSNVESLASLGGGMSRLFAIALALLGARGGFLLVDEIENGLHYSIHEQMWRLVASAAERFGVQVVAATHSWDCSEGFQAAAIADSVLIRLDRREDDTFAVLFDERDVAIATRGSIEIR